MLVYVYHLSFEIYCLFFVFDTMIAVKLQNKISILI